MAVQIAYEPHRRQAEVHASDARFKLIRAGRQSGKSLGAIAELSAWATEQLGPLMFWWCTASYRVKDRAWRGLAEHLPKEIVRKKHESELYVELTNGSRIYIKSADAPESLVSESVHGLVCDEAAQWKPDVWPQLLRPTLAVTKGPAVFVSSPRGRNWFYDLEQHARSSGDPDWAAFAWRSTDSPYFSLEEYERAKREMPERIFRQEIEAEYLAEGGDVFRRVDAAVGPLGNPDGYVVLGVDLARVRDWTVLWAVNSAGETVEVHRLRDLDWSLQKPRIVEVARRLRAKKVLIDATGMHVGADAVVNDLRAEGVVVEPVTITGPLKRAMIEAMMVRFDHGAIRLPADPVILEEFRGFTSEMLPSGHERYAAPSGRHDDCVMACALAIYGIRQFAGRNLGAAKKTELEELIERELRKGLAGLNPEGSGWTF